MGRHLEKSSGMFVPNYNQNVTESNASRFTCRCIYTTPGTHTFTVPSGVCSITAVAVGPGGCANCVVKVAEKYIYKTCDCLTTSRNQYTCSQPCCICPCNCSFGCDQSGIIFNNTSFQTCFCLGGYPRCDGDGQTACFRNNYDYVYSQLDYAVIDSGPGGGYSEKEITTTPGSTFCITVGVSTGNNFSCVDGQICATGPIVQNGTGISTESQYTCFCCCACESYFCYVCPTCRTECYRKSGPVCYIKEKQTNSCLVPGCGYGGTINRSGGFGCIIKSFCFPLGFDNLNCDQCSSTTTSNCGAAPLLSIRRSISLQTSIVSDPRAESMSVCPSDLVQNHTCYYPTRISYYCNFPTYCFRGAAVRRNCFNYSDSIERCYQGCGTCIWSPLCHFTIPECYCGVCFSSCPTNFIGIVTDVSNINCLSVKCNMSGGSSSGSPCYNGVYQPSISNNCILDQTIEDRPTITSCASGRPVFSQGAYYCDCPIEARVYGTYDPSSIDLGYSRFALVANTGCNPCNCNDIGCFFCTCKFDIIKNMWGIVSGPECFSYGNAGIGNSLTLCDPLYFVRSAMCSDYDYRNGALQGTLCCGCCMGCVSYYGTAYTNITCLWCTLSQPCGCYTSVCGKYCLYNCGCLCVNSCVSLCSCYYTCCCYQCYPVTNYWPTCVGYSCTGGPCCSSIPVFNIYELLCDSDGKCVNFCYLCTDAGKQFQTSLGEHGLDVFRTHFSPCVCSAKCFGSYNDWPCYFASVGIGTTIPCGGNSPLVPRQELTVCDPRYIPNNYHRISVSQGFNFGCVDNIWATGSCCIFCNSFATATSNLRRGYKIGTENDAGAGTGYVGNGSCACTCYSYVVAMAGTCSSISRECDYFSITSYGGGGGHYSSCCCTKITCLGRCSVVVLTPSGGKGWGDYDSALITSNATENKFNPPPKEPKLNTWFDTRQAKGSGATGPISVGSECYPAVKAGPGGGGIGGFGDEYASTCVFGGAACSGTAGPGGGAGGQGVPGTGMVVIYWNP